MNNNNNFALLGVGGYIAPRHLQAIKDTGNNLVVAFDPNDSVGKMDGFFLNAEFFRDWNEFEDFFNIQQMNKKSEKIDYISICSPNYFHEEHIKFALTHGANAICEKPLVLNVKKIDELRQLEKLTNQKIYTILQLRLHPIIQALKRKIESDTSDKKYDIDLIYITPRGKWYHKSWKGDENKSGGVATNIGIHFFDMLIWIFGDVNYSELHYSDKETMAGYIELDRARVNWFLSIDGRYSPNKNKTYRSITVDNEEVEFTEGFTELHTEVYKDIFNGGGFGLNDVRSSIEFVEGLRTAPIIKINPEQSVTVHEPYNSFIQKILIYAENATLN